MKNKLNIEKAEKEIDKAVKKLIKDYGCVLSALARDNESFIEECEKSKHKLYHK